MSNKNSKKMIVEITEMRSVKEAIDILQDAGVKYKAMNSDVLIFDDKTHFDWCIDLFDNFKIKYWHNVEEDELS